MPKFLLVVLMATSMAILSGCATTASNDPAALARMDKTKIDLNQTFTPEQEEELAWAINESGKPHTHIVRLPGCSDRLLRFTHVHRPDQDNVRMHKHDGCFVCPPKKEGVKRIL